MRTRRVVMGAVVSGLVSVWNGEAEACSAAQGPGGYVESITFESVLDDDPSSRELCKASRSTCGFFTRYEGALRYLKVRANLVGDAGAGQGATYVPSGGIAFVLKDDAGNVLEEQTGYVDTVYFHRVGAKACVKTTTRPDDSPSDVDGGPTASELCVPITATSLDVTEGDRKAHLAEAKMGCEEANAPFVADAADDGGGCNASGSSPASVMAGAFGLLGLALASARRRRRSVG